MVVFTDEWVQRVQNRFKRLPEYQRPPIYQVVTNEAWQQLRDDVERLVAGLPDAVQKHFTSRLQVVEYPRFIEAYNELRVGDALKQLGFEIDYGKRFGNQTPDLYVYGRADIPPFVVEIFSIMPSREEEQQRTRISWLYNYLHRIPIGAVLQLQLSEQQLPEQQKSPVIAEQVRHWLDEEKPPVGASREFHGILFTRIAGPEDVSHVCCIGPASAFMVDTARLQKRIAEKLHKYKALAVKFRLPLVVAVVADPLSGLEYDNLLDVLLGKEVVQLSYNTDTEEIFDQHWVRKPNGVMPASSATAALSTGLWVHPLSLGYYQLKALFNPEAAHPLPSKAFLPEEGGVVTYIDIPDKSDNEGR